MAFGLVDLIVGNAKSLGRQAHAVETFCQLDQRSVAPGAHIGNELAHDTRNILFAFALHVAKLTERRIEICLRRIKPERHRPLPSWSKSWLGGARSGHGSSMSCNLASIHSTLSLIQPPPSI